MRYLFSLIVFHRRDNSEIQLIFAFLLSRRGSFLSPFVSQGQKAASTNAQSGFLRPADARLSASSPSFCAWGRDQQDTRRPPPTAPFRRKHPPVKALPQALDLYIFSINKSFYCHIYHKLFHFIKFCPASVHLYQKIYLFMCFKAERL